MESLVIPDIYCPFPSLTNPNIEQAKKHSLEWAKDFRLIQRDAAQQHFLIAGVAHFGCSVHPKAALEELCFCCDWYCLITLFDDHFDDTERGKEPELLRLIHDHLLAVLQNPPKAIPQGLAAEAFSDIQQRAARLAPPTWQKHFVQHHADFFAGQLQDAENRAAQHIPDIQACISNRLRTYGTLIVFDAIQLVRHFELPAEIYASPPFQAVLQAAGNVMGWTNDVFSVERELKFGEVNNLVGVVQHVQGGSLQDTVNHVCALIETETRHLQKLIQDLPEYPTEVDRDIHTFLDDLGSWIRGNLDAHRQILRYLGHYFEPGKASTYLEEILPPA